MNAFLRNMVSSTRFAQLLLLLSLTYYGHDLMMHELLLKRPSGIHQWRQCDGASLAMMFYSEGNGLLEPQIHNQLGGVGKAGGEFPVLYYFSAKLYHLFGPQELILRLVHFSCFLLGLMLFLHYATTLFEWKFLAVIPIMLSVSSPTLMYYSLNFLPDTPAFGLSLAASALFLIYLKNGKPAVWWVSLLLFSLAGLIKISMLLPWFAFMGVLVMNMFFPLTSHKISWLRVLQSALTVLLPSVLWYVYIAHYNEINHGQYFTTRVTPFWLIPDAEFDLITERLFDDWLDLVFPKLLGKTVIVTLLLFAVLWKRLDAFLKWSTLLMIIGAVLYVPMFYIAFADHDYYFITLFIPVIFLFTTTASAVFQLRIHRFFKPVLLVGMAVLIWQTTGHAVRKTKNTYNGWYRDLDLSDSFHTLEPFLEAHGITDDKKVFVSHDFSPNRSLYLMNRKGWTQLTGIYDTDDLDLVIERGAAYAVVPDTSFYSVTFLQYHITDTIGFHNEIGVYAIDFSPWYKSAE